MCGLRNPQPYGAQTKNYTYLNNPWVQVSVRNEITATHGNIKPLTQPLTSYLDNPIVTKILIGGVVVATVAIGVFVAPEMLSGVLIYKVATQ